MTFGLKNADTTYQRAMNLIFYDLLGIILEINIDEIITSDNMDHHLANLCLTLERICRYGLKMNPLKCAFGVSARKFLGFIIYEHGLEIDPKKIESIKKVQPPQSKNDMQKFLGKLNYLRWFISNLSGKITNALIWFFQTITITCQFYKGKNKNYLLPVVAVAMSPRSFCQTQPL
jgi:hypothetical protein